MSLTRSLVRPRRLGPPLIFHRSPVLRRDRRRRRGRGGGRLVAVRAVRAGTTAAAAAGGVSAPAAAAAAGQPFDGRAHLEGGAELHAEPAGEVLLGQEGERAAVDALLSKGLEEDGRKIQLDCLSIK